MPAATTMDHHSAETSCMMDARRSHSYDESFLYYGEGQQRQRDHPPLQTSSSAVHHRRPHPVQQQQQREGPPRTSRDDIAIGTTVVSPLGRFRAHYEQQQQQGRSLIPTVSPPDDADSVPFDQQSDDQHRSKPRIYQHQQHYSPSTLLSDRSAKLFDEESQSPAEEYQKPIIQSRVHGPHRSPIDKEAHLPHHQEQQTFVDPRFRMPPIRVSKPALDAGVDDEDAPHDEQMDYDSEPPSLHQFGKQYYQPHSSPGSMMAHPPGSPMHARMRGIDDTYEEFGNASKGNTTEEDDSLFDFGGKQRPKQQQQQGSQDRRNAKKKILPRVGDETSEDGGDEPSASLALRTQEAWKRKSARQPKNNKNINTYTDESQQHVSFSATNPLIHRYNENATEASTLAGASLNSEYTKSIESEVEDAIKDIFLIGSGTGNNPGRRKLKYRPDMRRRLRWEKTNPEDDDDEDNDTIESDDNDEAAATASEQRIVVHGGPKANDKGNPNSSASTNKNSRAIIRNITPREEKKDTEGDALLGAWTIVESGLHAVGAALGIDTADDATEMTMDDSRQGYDSETIDTETRKPSSRKMWGKQSKSRRTSSNDLSDYSGGGQSRSSAEGESSSTPIPSTTEKKSPTAENNLLDYWSNALLGKSSNPVAIAPSEKESSSKGKEAKRSNGVLTSSSKNSLVSSTNDKQEKALPSLDKDLRLIELAVQSARSYHKVQGLVYDESDVDIVTDIKFVVVDLTLPLGLIFQENETGCWVTKVLTDGSAIKKSIQVGDQLAAIDGKSAIRLNVEDIAVAIRQKKSRPFELTFLRYVGPLRPAATATEEEGYEIKARSTTAESKHQSSGRKVRKEKAMFSTQAVAKPATEEQTVEDSPNRDKRRFRFFGRKNK